MAAFEHHASYVLMHLTRKIADHVGNNQMTLAWELQDLVTALEKQFPEARSELDRIYPPTQLDDEQEQVS